MFVQSINYESFSLEDGRVKAGSFHKILVSAFERYLERKQVSLIVMG